MAKSPADICFFLESGRAGALLESLGSRDELAAAAVPPQLQDDEATARHALEEAQAKYDTAVKAGKRKGIRVARDEVEAARTAYLKIVAMVQRAAKASADVVYPQAAELAAIQAPLDERDALVTYAVLSTHIYAFVVTQKTAELHELGSPTDLAATVAKLALHDPKSDSAAALNALENAIVAPLDLPKQVARVLVSPHGSLSHVPFAPLVAGREVGYVPSGTTFGLLREQGGARGESVLALGDPDYGSRAGSASGTRRRAGALTPLPGTRAEVTAIGDTVLLGRDASEANVRNATKKKERWRAVHFACHGLIDAERPTLSSLAITPAAGGDGFLTTFEVFQMTIPADLVVLSACETGRGKVYGSEAMIGFTRAFMFAGAPRVIVSLWKVDDEATRALMTKFYELWKPGKISTAAALRQAQEHVRSVEKWKHPYYWAAWQLWGVGD